MNRLQCVGQPSGVSSKDNEKEVAPLKPVIVSSADPVAKESLEWKPKQQKPKPSGKTREQDFSVNSETSNIKAPSSTRQQKAKASGKREEQDPSIETEGNPSLNSETSNSTVKAYNSKSSRGYNASKAPSFRNVTTHGHKLPKQVPPIMTETQGECEVQSESVHELHIQAPQVVPSANEQDPHEGQSEEDEENESAEGHVPLELFAEFLQAVMTKNYQLAKKLCQMILIYEPENSEAKSFLPLIEEKLLIEVEEESDDDDDDDEFDTSDDDDDDDVEDDGDESTDSSDTDEESTESTDDTLSSSS